MAKSSKRTIPKGKPHYDAEEHELWYRGRLVKRFIRSAPWQEMILAAFEEEGWPGSIDDPLPGTRTGDPVERLHDAVKGLNHAQAAKLLRFHTARQGRGIRWEAVVKNAP